MKTFQQNLLIALAAALCLLCAFQWYGQTRQRNQIETLNQLVYEKSVAIRDDTNSMAVMNHQIAQMDSALAAVKETLRTNEDLLAAGNRQINDLQSANETLTNQVAGCQAAAKLLQAKLKEAYAGITRQNDAIKELVSQRDDLVKKYNDSIKDRNDVVTKYNDLVAQITKQQKGGKE